MKERVDVLAVGQGLFESREQAKRSIMAGEVYDQNNERLDKPGVKIAADSQLHAKGKKLPYVSRGGLKLAKALKSFDIDVAGRTVLDIGSSTGGFTDVCLQNGAKQVYALDVGTNQLVWKLRSDERVHVMEQMNFRYAKSEDFTFGDVEFAVTDVSFISLKLILPPLRSILLPQHDAVMLIKPQFEAGRDKIGKHGIIKDPAVHREVLEEVTKFAVEDGYSVEGLDFSPIKGGEGNIEFLVHLRNVGEDARIQADVSIDDVLAAAHGTLD